jgi:hypothetical protein
MSHIFSGWTQGMPESLTASRFSALKGLPILARGNGAKRRPPRVSVVMEVSPSPCGSFTIGQNPLWARGEGFGGVGRHSELDRDLNHPLYPAARLMGQDEPERRGSRLEGLLSRRKHPLREKGWGERFRHYVL